MDMPGARVLIAREHVHCDPAPPELATQLADIDVHTACFFAAERCQWARMQADHRDALDCRHENFNNLNLFLMHPHAMLSTYLLN